MSHFECRQLNWQFWHWKKVVQVVQIGGRGRGNLDKIQKNSIFSRQTFPSKPNWMCHKWWKYCVECVRWIVDKKGIVAKLSLLVDNAHLDVDNPPPPALQRAMPIWTDHFSKGGFLSFL